MTEKRMLIIPSELVKKIDENRGDLSQAEFIHFLIQNTLEEKTKESSYATKEELKAFEEELNKFSQAHSKKYATQEEFAAFEQDLKTLFKKFIDFFIGYELELGKQTPLSELEKLTSKLSEFESDLPPGGGKEVKIKYK
jgi:hypothetical protein